MQVRATLVGANLAAPITGEGVQAHPSHFYIGNDPAKWRSNVPSYGAVRFDDVYPGIDLEYFGRGGQLEYDFFVAPGVDVGSIRIRYEGIEKLAITDGGDLEVTTRFGRMIERAPFAYQSIDGRQRPVRTRFRLEDANTFGFAVEERYDESAELVIDPPIFYSTFLGGASYDEVHDITFDSTGISTGSAYVVGGTQSSDFPTSGGPPAGSYDAYVSKLVDDGSALAYSVFIGGTNADIGYGVTVDTAGNAYLTGNTGSSDFPTTAGAYDQTFNGANPGEIDMFVSQLSPTGTLLYSTYLGGSTSDIARRIKINPWGGSVFVMGYTGSSDYPTTANAHDVAHSGASDVVLSKLDLLGNGAADLVYSTFLGGSSDDEGYDLAITGAGIVYAAGATRSADFPAGGGPPFNGTFDAFVAKIVMASAGVSDLEYATKVGGSGQDYALGVAVDFTPHVYLAGVTASTNFPTTPSAYQTTYGGGSYDGFVTRLASNGSIVVYSTLLGGSASDRVHELALGENTSAVVTGMTTSSEFPTTGNAYDATFNGGDDIFITAFSSGGDGIIESTFLGGSQPDYPWGFAIDERGAWYVAGTTTSADFPTTPGAFDQSFNGYPIDVVVAKFEGPRDFPMIVPTLSEWGLILFGMLLLTTMFVMIYRRGLPT